MTQTGRQGSTETNAAGLISLEWSTYTTLKNVHFLSHLCHSAMQIYESAPM